MQGGIDIRHLLHLGVDGLIVVVRVRSGATRGRLAQTRAPFNFKKS